MEFFFMWAVFAAAAGSMAKGKNRNILGWVLIGLVLGPIACLVIGMMKPGPGADQGYN